MILKTYKDFEIDVSAYGTFTAAGIDKGFNTYEEIIEAIDKASKLKYKPLDGYYLSQNKVFKVIITRPAASSYSGTGRYWVKHEDGRREILSLLVLDTEENRALLELWKLEIETIKSAQERKTALENKMRELPTVLEQV